MYEKIAITRSGMARARSALRLAGRGHDLLEQKRRVLMNELMGRIREAREVQADMRSVFGAAYFSLQMANISMGIDSVEKTAMLVPEENRFVVRLRSVMGVDIPEIDPVEPNLAPVYSMGETASGTSSVLDNAYVSARRLVALIARVAEVETGVYRLAVQIRRTLRRVNALEKVVIPRNRRRLRLIEAALEENEREDLTRIRLSLPEIRPGE